MRLGILLLCLSVSICLEDELNIELGYMKMQCFREYVFQDSQLDISVSSKSIQSGDTYSLFYGVFNFELTDKKYQMVESQENAAFQGSMDSNRFEKSFVA